MTLAISPLRSTQTVPFLRWAGGKRWLVPQLEALLAGTIYDRVVEPFAGSAAVSMGLRAPRTLLGDINAELTCCLRVVRDNPADVASALALLPNNASTFAAVRSSQPTNELERATRMLYLNRTAWGGLYRVNQKGLFNVPFGNTGRSLEIEALLLEASDLLANAEITTGDWKETVSCARVGDLVFMDPPYVTMRAERESFARYSAGGFTLADQLDVRNEAARLASAGVLVVVTTAADPLYFDLYSEWHHLAASNRVNLGASTAKRGDATEFVFVSANVTGPRGAAPHP